jgi:hypothetical protein
MARFISAPAPLPAAGDPNDTFTSSTIQPEAGDNVVGLIFTDQPGTLNVDQSADGGANWDFTTAVAVLANTGKEFSVPVYGNAIRVRFENTGASSQTVFRLRAKISSAGPRS